MNGWEASFVENMTRERQRRGLSQTALAKAVQQRGVPCHQQTIARIENGSRSVRLNEAQEITEILFQGDWQRAVQAVSLEALEQLLRETLQQSRSNREDARERLHASFQLLVSGIKTVRAAMERYAREAVRAEAMDEGLVKAALDELTAWDQAFKSAVDADRYVWLSPEEAGDGEHSEEA